MDCMSDDCIEQSIAPHKATKVTVKLDESRTIAGEAILLVFVRYVVNARDNEDNVVFVKFGNYNKKGKTSFQKCTNFLPSRDSHMQS